MTSKDIDLEMQRLPTKRMEDIKEENDAVDGKGKESADDGQQEAEETDGHPVTQHLRNFSSTIKHTLEWLRVIILCSVALGIIFIVVYNFFASAEKDIPDEVMNKLYKFLELQAGANLGDLGQAATTTTTNRAATWQTAKNSTGH